MAVVVLMVVVGTRAAAQRRVGAGIVTHVPGLARAIGADGARGGRG